MRPGTLDILIEKHRRKVEEEKAAKAEKKRLEREEKKRQAVLLRKSIVSKEKRKEFIKKFKMYDPLPPKPKKKKKAHRKERIRRAKHRYYIRHIKRPRLRRRIHKGDERAIFVVLITRNKKYFETISWYGWKNNAFKKFNDCIAENRRGSLYPVQIEETDKKGVYEPVKYEIIIKKKTEGLEGENVSEFRDDMGRMITVTTDNPSWKIIAKEDWFIEERFFSYKSQSNNDFRTASYLYKNVILDGVHKNGYCRVFIWKKYLFFETENNFTFSILKTEEEAIRLYNILQNKLYDRENVFFTGPLSKTAIPSWIEKVMEKTGWSEYAVRNARPPKSYLRSK